MWSRPLRCLLTLFTALLQSYPPMENHDRTASCKPLEKFELYGWKPSPDLSVDENIMDLVMLVTRSSHCKQGSMACVISHPLEDSKPQAIYESLVSIATNRALYSKKDSDVHAEIAALGQACRTGSVTDGCQAFITMPPCKRCFAALTVAGIKRVVTRFPSPQAIQDGAKLNGIELVALGNVEEQTRRINLLVYGDQNGKKREQSDEVGDHATKRKKTGGTASGDSSET